MSADTDKLRAQLVAVRDSVQAIIDGIGIPSIALSRTPVPKPALKPLGPAGVGFEDQAFGSRMLRVTDQRTGGGDPTSWRTSSTSDRIWNADGSMLFAEATGGQIKVFGFDRNRFAVEETPYGGSLVGATWHESDPKVIFGRDPGERPAVVRYELGSGKKEIVADVLSLVPEIAKRPRTYLRGVSHCGGILSFICGGETQDRDDFAVALPLDQSGPKKVVNLKSDPRVGVYAHACQSDLSGRYLVIGAAVQSIAPGGPKVYVVDLQEGIVYPVVASTGGHWGIGLGEAVNAPDDVDSQEIRHRPLGAKFVEQADLVIENLPEPTQWFASSHFSWNHAATDCGWVLAGNYRFGEGYPVTDKTPWREWDDEIVKIKIGDGTVERKCHHRSDVRHDLRPESAIAYWATPRPRSSADGRYAAFTSNREKTLGTDPALAADPDDKGAGSSFRQDVFLVEL